MDKFIFLSGRGPWTWLNRQKWSSLAELFQKLQLQFTLVLPGKAWASFEKENLTNNLWSKLVKKKPLAPANPNKLEY